ncbi:MULTISPECIES: hypothetical protein [unclassified Pseudomonas]|uniref:hypothetical protein n=1 Tax=unclassified Pseudomonas TaxID=196821 RepID=UPI001FD2CF21|nr:MULTISPECIES: hypothetical protein [unclassified Pseudomonas]
MQSTSSSHRDKHNKDNKSEDTRIGDAKTPFSWKNVRAIGANRMMLGIYLGQFCLTSITWFFLTWFPTYLIEAKGMTMLKVGLVPAIPPIAGCLGWCIVGDVSPKRAMGISGAMFNFCGNIASIVTPIAIGVLVTQLGSFDAALMYVAAMGLLGAFAYLFIVGPLKRMDIDELNDSPTPVSEPLKS